MRILFLLSGNLWKHTLPEGFREAGHEVKTVSVKSEQALSSAIAAMRPDFAVSIGWSREQGMNNLLLTRRCLNASKTPHIYWSVEDPEYTSVFTLPLIQTNQPDFVFTICPSKVSFYESLGYPSAYMDFGYAPRIHHIEVFPKQYKIAVVANAYPDILSHYPNHFRHQSIETLILPLLRENIRIDFWGRGWAEATKILNCTIPGQWLHGHQPYAHANQIYNAAHIVIGLQNYETQITQRTYEILASGGFLLTNDTSGVKSLFNPTEDLITSASPKQTLERISYYLNHPEICAQIAERGRQKVQPFSYRSRAESMLRILKSRGIINST